MARIMDTRSRDILLVLLSSPTPLTMEDIASFLRITPRMVRYSLGNIEAFLKDEDSRLIRKPRQGLSIDASRRDREALLAKVLDLERLPLVLSPAERFHRILHALLLSEEPILVKQLVPQLGVSRTTVLGDINRVEEWLGKFGISMVRRPNYGFRLIAPERAWRESIVSALLDCTRMPLALLDNGNGDFCTSEVERTLGPFRVWCGFIEELELSLAERLVSWCQDLLCRNFTDRSYVSLVLHLALQIRRIREGMLVCFSTNLQRQLEKSEEMSVAVTIAKEAERSGVAEFPEQEIAFIAAQLAGAKTSRPISSLIWVNNRAEISKEAEGLAKELAAAASLYLHPALCADSLLINNLGHHIEAILSRLRCGLPIVNPMLSEIKSQHGLIFDIARRSSEVIEKKVGVVVPDDEIGYLCMHLGAAAKRLRSMPKARVLVVCSQGTATSWLLVSDLMAEFANIEVMDVVSVRQLSRAGIIPGNIDFIISTVPFEMKGLRIVIVNPMLSNEDKARIREEIERILSSALSKSKKGDVVQRHLRELINPDTVRVRVPARDWEEVVDLAGNLLYRVGGIQKRYISAMKEVISDRGPYMVMLPGVALLHASPDQGVISLCIGIVTLCNPIRFGHPINDPVDIAIVLGTPDDHAHLLALRELSDLIQDREMLEAIRRANTPSDIVTLIRKAC